MSEYQKKKCLLADANEKVKYIKSFIGKDPIVMMNDDPYWIDQENSDIGFINRMNDKILKDQMDKEEKEKNSKGKGGNNKNKSSTKKK